MVDHSFHQLTLELDTGTVKIKFRPDLAPGHVQRVGELANEGFYNDVPFHRVIAGFMAQGGDGGRKNGTGGSTKPNLKAEFSAATFDGVGSTGLGTEGLQYIGTQAAWAC